VEGAARHEVALSFEDAAVEANEVDMDKAGVCCRTKKDQRRRISWIWGSIWIRRLL
jgi:hypothetical protein